MNTPADRALHLVNKAGERQLTHAEVSLLRQAVLAMAAAQARTEEAWVGVAETCLEGLAMEDAASWRLFRSILTTARTEQGTPPGSALRRVRSTRDLSSYRNS